MEQPAPSHPIRLVVTDDLVRSRLTVFFRLLLAIPHLFVLALWSTVAFVIAVINWFATLVKGQSPQGLHDFLANYLRYATRVEAYLLLTGNPFPPFFVGSRMSEYPIDLEIGPPARQNRWKTLFRGLLALPAIILSAAFLGGPIAWGLLRGSGVAGATAFLTWFSALARGRSPRGLRDLSAWSVGYGAQVGAYLFLLTDRYPYTGPKAHLAGLEAPEVSERVPELANDDDYRRSRLTVLLRLPLAFPHIIWLIGWTILARARRHRQLVLGAGDRPLAAAARAVPLRVHPLCDARGGVHLRGGKPVSRASSAPPAATRSTSGWIRSPGRAVGSRSSGFHSCSPLRWCRALRAASRCSRRSSAGSSRSFAAACRTASRPRWRTRSATRPSSRRTRSCSRTAIRTRAPRPCSFGLSRSS